MTQSRCPETRRPDWDDACDAVSEWVALAAAQVRVRTIRITYRARHDFPAPQFPGAMFRGAFGHALLDTYCVRPEPDQGACDGCWLARSCAVPHVFQPVQTEGGAPEPAAPFVPRWTPLRLGRETDFALDLVLLGDATDWAPAAIAAAIRMGREGFGASRTVHDVLDIRGVEPGGALVAAPGPVARILDVMPASDPARPFAIDLLTPLRIKSDGRIATDLDFALLAVNCERRLRLAATQFGGARLPPLPDWLRDAAAEVRTVPVGVRWEDPSRYSTRQDARVPLGGLAGRLVFEGPTSPFVPLFAAASVLHIGKATSSGLGRFERVPPEPSPPRPQRPSADESGAT